MQFTGMKYGFLRQRSWNYGIISYQISKPCYGSGIFQSSHIYMYHHLHFKRMAMSEKIHLPTKKLAKTLSKDIFVLMYLHMLMLLDSENTLVVCHLAGDQPSRISLDESPGRQTTTPIQRSTFTNICQMTSVFQGYVNRYVAYVFHDLSFVSIIS